MSDSPQGDGWWIASDGKWYPPQTPPTPPPAASPEPQQPPTQPQQPVQQPPPAPGVAQGQQSPPGPGQAPGTPPPYAGAAGAPGTPGGTPEDDDSKGGKGKWIALVIVLLLIAGGVAAFFLLSGDDDEGDVDGSGDKTDQETDIGDATGDVVDDGPIEFNKQYNSTLEGDRTERRYTLDAPDGAIMTVEVSNERASQAAVRTVYESAGERFVDLRAAPGAAESDQVILAAGGGAPFELVFTEGPAEFTFKVGLETQDDAGQGGDAGEDLPGAFEVTGGQRVAGLLGGEDAIDHYTVEVEPGTELTLQAEVPAEAERPVRFMVELDGDRLFDERVQPGGETDLSTLMSDADSGELSVITSEGQGDYTFTATFVTNDEGGGPGDAPAELAGARKVAVTGAIEGSVGDRDEGDYYLFDAPAVTFNITATSDAASESAYRVLVEDAQGARVADFRVQPGAETTEAVELAAVGEVRLQVTEGNAAYSIKIG